MLQVRVPPFLELFFCGFGCLQGMVYWVVLEEMKIPYVMDTTPLRAYLRRPLLFDNLQDFGRLRQCARSERLRLVPLSGRPGEKKRQRLVPVIQLLDEELLSSDPLKML